MAKQKKHHGKVKKAMFKTGANNIFRYVTLAAVVALVSAVGVHFLVGSHANSGSSILFTAYDRTHGSTPMGGVEINIGPIGGSACNETQKITGDTAGHATFVNCM